MHDIVHEMIKKIAVEENFMDHRYRNRNMCSTTHGANFEEFAIDEIPEADTLMKQRTLSTWVDLDDRFLRCLLGAPRLRVLELSSWMLTSHQRHWVQGISTLRNLSCMRLDFLNQAELPDSFEGLHNLKVLVIKPSLSEKLPPSIATLEKLVILDVDAPRLENMPHGLGRLSNLEKLLRYRPPDGSFNEDSCWELEKMSKLRELEVVVSLSDEMEEEALKVLAELPVLKVLRVRIRGAPVSGQRSARITRFYDEMLSRVGNLQLRPLQRLEELHILYHPGESVPAWLNSTTFPNLRLVYFEFDWILRITFPGMTALMARIGQAIPHARIKFGDESTQ